MAVLSGAAGLSYLEYSRGSAQAPQARQRPKQGGGKLAKLAAGGKLLKNW